MGLNHKKTLDEWREAIAKEVPYVDVKPYSHNIISICLGAIAQEWGRAEADRAIDDFGLKELGWMKEDHYTETKD